MKEETVVIKEKDIGEIKEELKSASEAIAKLQAFESHIPEVNLYLNLNTEENSKTTESFNLIATERVLDARNNVFLLGSYKTKNYAVQKALDIFENSNEPTYEKNAKNIIANMLQEEIYKDASKELSTLIDMGMLKVIETTEEMQNRLKESDKNKIYKLFEEQYISSHPSLELTYQSHPILQEIKTEDKEILADKYDLSDDELEFLKVAAKLDVDRVLELTEEFLDEKPISKGYNISVVHDKSENNKSENDKELLELLNITVAIYDKYNLPIDENKNGITAEGIKEAAEKVVSEFIKNDVSLYYVIDKIEQAKSINDEVMKIIENGFTYDTVKEIQKENKNQMYMDIDSLETSQTLKAELKTFSL